MNKIYIVVEVYCGFDGDTKTMVKAFFDEQKAEAHARELKDSRTQSYTQCRRYFEVEELDVE